MIITTLLVLIPVLAAWDYGRRRLNREKEMTLLVSQKLEAAQEVLTELASKQEKHALVLKTFLDSMTDIIKISEEEKQELRNRLSREKIGKKL